ncbi:MAG: aldo/keto reductase [Sphaerochaeta sp.]|nr:aldo/keto reductase [Sphaerochaeta sp.]
METRTFEKVGIITSLLGFGAMRLPLTQDGTIDEPRAEEMMELAIKFGVNYIDTAYPYHEGKSEAFVGRVLKKYPRKTFFLATKLPCWKVNSLSDAKKIFAEQLENLQMEYVDFYLLHAIDGEAYDKMVGLGVVTYLEKLKKEGKIRHIGFSFHGIYEDFERIIQSQCWDFCQIQYNYLDTEDQAGTKGYLLAEKLGIPVIVMEPIKGGSLASLPPDLQHHLNDLDGKATPASFALRWVGSHPYVKVILSGMSTLEQVSDNLRTFSDFKKLTEKEYRALDEIGDIMRGRVGNGCTGCKYCMPCAFGVDIPGNFALWNRYRMFQDYDMVKKEWENATKQDSRPPVCTECGQCVPLCPQNINIPEDLKRMQAELSKAQEESANK